MVDLIIFIEQFPPLNITSGSTIRIRAKRSSISRWMQDITSFDLFFDFLFSGHNQNEKTNFVRSTLALLFSFRLADEGPNGGWIPSECCSRSRFFHPLVACQRR